MEQGLKKLNADQRLAVKWLSDRNQIGRVSNRRREVASILLFGKNEANKSASSDFLCEKKGRR